MKTKTQLIEELDDTVVMLVDAVDARNWVVASGAAVHIEALCAIIGNATSATHPICKTCVHRWDGSNMPPCHPGSWCYMFRDGSHLDQQGYCGQHRLATLSAVHDSLSKLGALLEQGSANVVHGE